MNKYLLMFYKVSSVLLLCMLTWFGLGPWLLNQPSSLMYIGGIVINLGVLVPVSFLLRSVYRDFKKEEK